MKRSLMVGDQLVEVDQVHWQGDMLRFTLDGVVQSWKVRTENGRIFLLDDKDRPATVTFGPRQVDGSLLLGLPQGTVQVCHRAGDAAQALVSDGRCLAPMSGTVLQCLVAEGDEVCAGQAMLVMEAMKLHVTVPAPFDGKVARLNAQPGSKVTQGELLVEVVRDAE